MLAQGGKWLGNRSLEIYLCNGILMIAVSLIDWNKYPEAFNYGNYFRYGVVIVAGLILADLAYRLKNRINACF